MVTVCNAGRAVVELGEGFMKLADVKDSLVSR